MSRLELFTKIELYEGVLRFNPFTMGVSLLLIIHFFVDWYLDYKKTGWKINPWHVSIFIRFIVPFFILYPFAASPLNVMSVGDAYIIYDQYVEVAFYITVLGYFCMYIGRFLYNIRKHSYIDDINILYKVIHTNINKSFGLYVMVILLAITLIAMTVMSINSGMLFNARGVFLTNPSIRPIGNFMSSVYPLVILYLSFRVFNDFSSKFIAIPSIMLLSFLGLFWGSRGMVFSALLSVFLYYLYLHRDVSLKKIILAGLVLVIAIMYLALLRGGKIGNISHLESIEYMIIGIAYGNTFSDLRDFAWILSGFNDEFFLGKTYISGIFSFLPSSLFEWRREFALGPITLDLAGLSNDSGEHPGLRGGSFYEIYLNFSLFGVMIWGIIIGYLREYANRGLRYYIEKKDVIRAYLCGMPAMIVGTFGNTTSMFTIYVFLVIHCLLLIINMIPIYLNSKCSIRLQD